MNRENILMRDLCDTNHAGTVSDGSIENEIVEFRKPLTKEPCMKFSSITYVQLLSS